MAVHRAGRHDLAGGEPRLIDRGIGRIEHAAARLVHDVTGKDRRVQAVGHGRDRITSTAERPSGPPTFVAEHASDRIG